MAILDLKALCVMDRTNLASFAVLNANAPFTVIEWMIVIGLLMIIGGAVYRIYRKIGTPTPSWTRLTDAQFEQELRHVARCRVIFQDAMQGVDALLTFSAPGQAPLVEDGTGASTFNRIWTTFGSPCLTLPAGQGAGGLPIGLQLVANHGQDYALLQLGKSFECIFEG